MKKSSPPQLDMFGTQAPTGVSAVVPPELGPAVVAEATLKLASRLAPDIRLGGSSWNFPGWAGLVYDGPASQQKLSREGLGPYSKHPLLRMVGIDRTFYAPVDTQTFAAYASVVPDSFRFMVKAQETLTLGRFPLHPRYGAQKGEDNSRFLDPEYARDFVVQPAVEGLKDKLGPIVFQFPPQSPRVLGGPEVFADTLHGFLEDLPRGPLYGVEVRNEELLTEHYAQALADVGAVPVLAGWRHMPSLENQASRTRALEGRALVVRWMLTPGLDYEDARQRYEPYDRLVDEDVPAREQISILAARAERMKKPVFVTINNKAEGSAPLSVEKLAEAIVGRTEAR